MLKKVCIGIIAGIVYGLIDVLLMIPFVFEDRTAAMLGAFVNRFGIGFFIATTHLPLASWIKGIVIGLLLSLPDAIITKAYAPILGIGILGGLVIGVVAGKTEEK